MRIVQILPPGEKADLIHSGAIFQVASNLSVSLSKFFGKSLVVAQDVLYADKNLPSYHYKPIRMLKLMQLSNLISFGIFPLHIGSFEILATKMHPEDLIIVHNNPWLFYLVSITYPENRIVFFAHNDVMRSFSNMSKKKLLKRASVILVISEYIGKQFATFDELDVLILPNSTSNESSKELIQKNFLEREIHIVFVGRFSKEKGLHILLRAYNRSVLKSMNLVFVVAGSQTHNSDLLSSMYARSQLRRINRLGIKYVGRVTNQEILELLRNSKFAVIPSIWKEPFSLVALEAVRAGAVPIYFDGGGIVEATGGKGIIVSPKKVRALRRVLNNQVASGISRPESFLDMDLTSPDYSWEDNALKLFRYFCA